MSLAGAIQSAVAALAVASPQMQLDFVRNIAWHEGKRANAATAGLVCTRDGEAIVTDAAGNRATFPPDTPAISARGLELNPATTQLLTNSEMVGGAVGAGNSFLPTGWSATGGAVAVVQSVAIFNGYPAIVVKLSATNPDVVEHSYKLVIEPNSGVASSAGDARCFSAGIEVLAIDVGININHCYLRIAARDGVNSIIGDDARVPLNPVGYQDQAFVARLMPAGTVKGEPSISFEVPAGGTGGITLRIVHPQFEPRTAPSAWIATNAEVKEAVARYAYVAPGSGAVAGVVGAGGALPGGWTTTAASRVQIMAVGSNYIEIEMEASGGGGGTTPSVRFNGTADDAMEASPGEDWSASIEAEIVTAPASANLRLSFAEIDGAGSSVASASTSLPTAGRFVTTRTRTLTAPTVVFTRAQLLFSVPASTTSVVRFRIWRQTSAVTAVTRPASGPQARGPEAIEVEADTRALLAAPSTIVMRGGLIARQGGEVWLAAYFGSRSIRVISGAEFGVEVYNGASLVGRMVRPVVTAPDLCTFALSWAVGRIDFAWPQGIGDYGGHDHLSVSGLDPAALSALWIGSNAGLSSAATFFPSIRAEAGAVQGAGLADLVSTRWAHPAVRAPHALVNVGPAAAGAVFVPEPPPSGTELPSGCSFAIVYGDEIVPPREADVQVFPPPSSGPYSPPVNLLLPSIYGPRNNPENPNRDQLDPCWNPIYLRLVNPLRRAWNVLSRGSNGWAVGDTALALRALRLLRDWANAGALLGDKNETGIFQSSIFLLCATQAYLGLRDAGGTRADHAAIRLWIRNVATQVQAYAAAQHAAGTTVGLNNHYFFEVAAIMGAGRALDHGPFVDWSIAGMKYIIDSANIHGAWPLELRRGNRALLYHCYSMGPVMVLAEGCIAMGFDPWAYAGGKLGTIVDFTMAGIDDPQLLKAEQQWQKDNVPGWENMPVADQLPVTTTNEEGDTELLESKVAWFIIPYRRRPEASWHDQWTDILADDFSCFVRNLGGDLRAIYPPLQFETSTSLTGDSDQASVDSSTLTADHG